MNLFGYNITRRKDKIFELLDNSNSKNIKDAVDNYYNDDFLGSIGVKKGEERSKLGNLISILRQGTTSRSERYKEYDRVAKDPVIGQAIEMMADDATQFDVDREKTIWIESPDKDYAEAINGIIQDYIEPFIDTVASRIVSRGEFIFKVSKEGKELRGDFKDVILLPYKNIERMHHLILENQEHYFFEMNDLRNIKQDDNYSSQLKEFDEFLHFINYSIENSAEVKLKLEDEKKETVIKSVFVLQGESVITDKILETFRILSSLEDAIIRVRLAKSKMIRFINVDVTKLTDNKKAQALVNYIHGALADNEAVGTDTYTASSIQAEPVTVTIPVRNGVGAIHVEEFATAVDIKDIADVDHFMSKLFAGLRTPRSYFNYDEALPGVGSSGASLTRTDIRYARAVKKIQRVLVNAIRDLIDIFNKRNNIDEKTAPEYKIKIVKVATAEDADRYLEIEQRMSTAQGLMQGIMAQEGGYNRDALTAYIEYFTTVVPMPEVVQFMNKILKKSNVISKPQGLKTTGVLKTNVPPVTQPESAKSIVKKEETGGV